MNSVQVKNDTNSLSGIYDELLSIYGPMMELGDLATVLKRNRNGIRNAVSQAERDDPDNAKKWAIMLAGCKTRIGKKILFRTRVVADLLETGEF
ncbi:MAG: hypothetical protein GX771_10385 [Halomonadaceae bacterium]|nr:hypothetical protein [Halomonadaceae bacterium]